MSEKKSSTSQIEQARMMANLTIQLEKFRTTKLLRFLLISNFILMVSMLKNRFIILKHYNNEIKIILFQL